MKTGRLSISLLKPPSTLRIFFPVFIRKTATRDLCPGPRFTKRSLNVATLGWKFEKSDASRYVLGIEQNQEQMAVGHCSKTYWEARVTRRGCYFQQSMAN